VEFTCVTSFFKET
jgi:hypothetical protein